MHGLQGDLQCLKSILNTKCTAQHPESSLKTELCCLTSRLHLETFDGISKNEISVFVSLFHIGDTAVREVFEETGVKSEFRSLLSIRQQHRNPGAFGKSDMYLICRLHPCSFTINFCQQECLKCEWMDLEKLARTENTTPITSRVARLLLYGHREGFDKIDLSMEELPSVYTGLFYKLYHRGLPESYRATTGVD